MKKISRLLIFFLVASLFFTSAIFAEDIEDTDTPTEGLPSYFNSVDEGWVTPVKFQNPFGTCWTFAAMAAAETNAIKKGAPLETTEFSEKALSYFAAQLQGSRTTPVNAREGSYLTTATGELLDTLAYGLGGSAPYTAGQLMTWNGLSSLANIPYSNSTGDYRNSPYGPMPSPLGNWSLNYGEAFTEHYHVNSAPATNYYRGGMRTMTKEEEIELIKENVYEYGAITIGCNVAQSDEDGTPYPYIDTETWAQYTPEYIQPDHAMAIVGYDDDYAIDNFKEGVQPPAPGAYIIKNSWSTNFGDEGYMYISYYDETISYTQVIEAETAETGYTFDNIYQYDYLGIKNNAELFFLYKFIVPAYDDDAPAPVEDQYSYANTFYAEKDEILKAVTVPSVWNTGTLVVDTQVYLNKGGSAGWKLVDDQTNSFADMTGIARIDLENEITLEPGDLYTVVQTTNYYDVLVADTLPAIPVLPTYNIEVANTVPNEVPITNMYGEVIGTMLQNTAVTINPGESYVRGIGDDPTVWYDLSDPNIQDVVGLDIGDNKFIPGNAMIKVLTENVKEEVPVTIELSAKEIMLSSSVSATRRSATVTAALTPADSDVEILWESQYPSVATVTGNGTSATIRAMAEGETTITATLPNGASASVDVVVDNDLVVVGSVQVLASSPDYYTINVINPTINPLLDEVGAIRKVSIFTWSAPDMSDLDCKVANLENGVFTYTFPVNNNEEHEYYDQADEIYINIYSSINAETDGNMVAAGYYTWMNLQSAPQKNIGYITYSQNIGFDQPTVFDGETAGILNDPESAHIEGLRISSNYYGLVGIRTQVYEEEKGWQASVDDGVYAGTMHEDRAIESVKLDLYGSYSGLFNLKYRVYQDGAWTEWVSAGQEAGIAGQGLPVEGIEVDLDLN